MYVCICEAVSEKDILDLVGAGASTAHEVMEKTRAGTRCGSCRSTVKTLVEGDGAVSTEGVDSAPSCGVRRLRMLRSASSAA
ncbi:MAG TPA: (2Fe-2S)-binding protein [Polyangium sp.]|nr:(2Fe-2S)-binding protein [Polyangium sp.]